MTVEIEAAQEEHWNAEIAEIWKKYDTDNSGKLEKDEAFRFMSDCMKELTGDEQTEEDLENHFAKMDVDKSGDIDKEECFRFLGAFRRGHLNK